MSIAGIEKSFAPIKPIESLEKPQGVAPGGKAGEANFQDVFSDALKEVNELQSTADNQIQGLTLGNPNVTIHDAMIALEKADVAFQLMNQIRSKIVRAYEDVMRTQV